MTITTREMADQVRTATDASDGTYDVDAITDELRDQFGLVDIDDIPADAFWTIVLAHAEA